MEKYIDGCWKDLPEMSLSAIPTITQPKVRKWKAKVQITEKMIWDVFPAVNRRRGSENKQKNIKGFVYTFNKYADYFGVDTKLEIRHFLAQLGHESDQFNAFLEYASGRAYEGDGRIVLRRAAAVRADPTAKPKCSCHLRDESACASRHHRLLSRFAGGCAYASCAPATTRAVRLRCEPDAPHTEDTGPASSHTTPQATDQRSRAHLSDLLQLHADGARSRACSQSRQRVLSQIFRPTRRDS